MNALLKKFWNDEDGGETVEWPLVVGVLAVLIVAALIAVRGEVTRVLGIIEDQLASITAG